MGGASRSPQEGEETSPEAAAHSGHRSLFIGSDQIRAAALRAPAGPPLRAGAPRCALSCPLTPGLGRSAPSVCEREPDRILESLRFGTEGAVGEEVGQSGDRMARQPSSGACPPLRSAHPHPHGSRRRPGPSEGFVGRADLPGLPDSACRPRAAGCPRLGVPWWPAKHPSSAGGAATPGQRTCFGEAPCVRLGDAVFPSPHF